MKVRDIMSKNLAMVNPSSTLTEAAQLMQKHNIGAIPVCDQNGLVGIVTDRDIVVRNIANGGNTQNSTVKDVMTPNVTTAYPDMDVDDATRIMSQQQIRRLPVVDNNRLIGMLALGDIAANPRTDTEASQALTDISRPAKPMNMAEKIK
jgi:CBS domain-containing protein